MNAASGFTPIERTTELMYENGNLVGVDGPLTAVDDSTRFRYDVLNRLAGMDLPNGQSIDITEFDARGRLQNVTRAVTNYSSGNPVVRSQAFEYDERGKLYRKILPDGQSLRYHYHDTGVNKGTLRAITHESLFGLRQYTVIAENGQTQTFSYNAGLLIGANTLSGNYVYRHDTGLNRTIRDATSADGSVSRDTYHYPSPGNGNRLLGTTDGESDGTTRYDYSASGAPVTTGGTYRYIYNADQRPVQVFDGDALLAEYRYNSFGERIAKVVYRGEGIKRLVA